MCSHKINFTDAFNNQQTRIKLNRTVAMLPSIGDNFSK